MSKTSFVRGSITFGATTLASRLFGMLRDVVVASVFGAGVATDAFYVAFRFANLFRAFFAEGAISQAFIPNLARVIERDPKHERLFVGNMLVILGVSLLILVVVLEITAEWVSSWYAFGYRNNPAQLALVTDLLRITLPYILLISIAALLNSVLQNHQRFFISGFSPVMLNLCMIASAFFAGQLFAVPIYALAWATVVAGCIQLVMPLWQLFHLHKLPKLRVKHWHPAVKKSLLMFAPAVLSASIVQIALLVDTLLATFLEIGSVTWLYIANRLIGFPLGVFGISIAVVVLPALSRARAKGNTANSVRIFGWAVHSVCMIAIPATFALIAVAEPIVITLFHYKAFTFTDALNASAALRMYALGLTGMMLMKILLNQFFAIGDATTPLKVGIVTTCLGAVLSIVFMQFIQHRGIALSTGLVSLANAGILYMIAFRRGLVVSYSGALWSGARIVLASAAMVLACLLLFGDTSQWVEYPMLERVLRLSLYVGLAMAVYVIMMFVLGWRIRHFRSP